MKKIPQECLGRYRPDGLRDWPKRFIGGEPFFRNATQFSTQSVPGTQYFVVLPTGSRPVRWEDYELPTSGALPTAKKPSSDKDGE